MSTIRQYNKWSSSSFSVLANYLFAFRISSFRHCHLCSESLIQRTVLVWSSCTVRCSTRIDHRLSPHRNFLIVIRTIAVWTNYLLLTFCTRKLFHTLFNIRLDVLALFSWQIHLSTCTSFKSIRHVIHISLFTPLVPYVALVYMNNHPVRYRASTARYVSLQHIYLDYCSFDRHTLFKRLHSHYNRWQSIWLHFDLLFSSNKRKDNI